jgi:hypothetical protein
MGITKAQFRWLLVVYFVVQVLAAWSDVGSVSVVPNVVRELELSTPRQYLPLDFMLNTFVLVAWLVGLIGLFCFWPLARYICFVAALLMVVTDPLLVSWRVYTGPESVILQLILFLDGVIFALCFLEPAKHLFENKKDEGTSQTAGFKDRKTRLVVFGILQIISGGLCALFVLLIIWGTIMSVITNKKAAHEVHWQTMAPEILLYVAMAAWLIWMGIGSIRTRRWARALILISSWLWLACGAFAGAFMLSLLPARYDQMEESGRIPTEIVTSVKFILIAIRVVLYVVIPGLLILFYSGRHVKATCEYRDPHIRWTDQCPLPVLGVSFVCAFWAVSLLSMGIYGWVIPFFGTILSGISGAIVIFGMILLLAYTVRGTYKLDIKAWWCILLVNVSWFLSMIITFSRVSIQTFYGKMGFSEQQLEEIKQFSMLREYTMYVLLVYSVVFVGVYLLYIRRYFTNVSLQIPASS